MFCLPKTAWPPTWNYIFVKNEDKSLGVHNSTYTMDLLDFSLGVFK